MYQDIGIEIEYTVVQAGARLLQMIYFGIRASHSMQTDRDGSDRQKQTRNREARISTYTYTWTYWFVVRAPIVRGESPLITIWIAIGDHPLDLDTFDSPGLGRTTALREICAISRFGQCFLACGSTTERKQTWNLFHLIELS